MDQKYNFLNDIAIDMLQCSHFYTICNKVVLELQKNPELITEIQMKFSFEFYQVYNKFFQIDCKTNQNIKDHRFKHPSWDKKIWFNFIKEIYLLVGKTTSQLMTIVKGLDDKIYSQIELYVRSFVDAISPSNFLLFNPELIQNTIDSCGENLLKGFYNFINDLVRNNGYFNISMTDFDAFKVGVNLAITPGKIIYQNDLMQLIQYLPTTKKVYKKPILFVPPWINKYYILDLCPDKSLVKWLVDQGHTVFMISWVNPGRELANKSFEDYMLEGPLAAIDQITNYYKCLSVNLVGYCIGGTLSACALAYMKQQGDNRVASCSYITTLLDFSSPGDLGAFIDEKQLDIIKQMIDNSGYMDGRYLDIAFNLLRPNDLIWPFFINNYLLGKKPKAFDLLYWNSDSTNLPAKMFNYYLRNMYLHNKLCKKGKLVLNNIAIDLSKISVPVFFIATDRDHITPWRSVYAGARLHNSHVTFVLSGSGHVASVTNHPANNKYGFKINTELPNSANKWLQGSVSKDGSWWTYWNQWLTKDNSRVISGLNPLKYNIPCIEDAPGSYVLKRI